MVTDLQSQTSRTNGARSSGPTSDDGKARSARNALKHGLSSKKILLPSESPEEFAALRAAHFDSLRPANDLEAEFVETLAATRWRLRRLAAIEANLLNNYILANAESSMDDSLFETGDDGKTAWAFRRLADGSALQLLVRYEGALSRTYDRTFKQLQVLQAQRVQSAQPILQNEPGPPDAPRASNGNDAGTKQKRALPEEGPLGQGDCCDNLEVKPQIERDGTGSTRRRDAPERH